MSGILRLGCTERPFYRPSERDAAAKLTGVHAGETSPLGHGARFSVPTDELGRAFIVRLIDARGPAAILRRVRAVVVVSLNGVLRRGARPHVVQERREIVAPPVAHADATTSVVLVEGPLRVVTPLLNQSPHIVFRCASALVCLVASTRRFSAQTSARFRATMRDVLSLVDAFLAAIAPTHPQAVLVFTTDKFKNNPAIEALANEIGHSHHYTDKLIKCRGCL